MRIVMVSKAFHRRAYRRQLAEIASAPEVEELTLVASPGWIDEGHLFPFEHGGDVGYDVRIERINFIGNFHAYFWPRLGRVLREKRPHLVHIDEEPFNLAAFLAAWHARRVGARAVFFTWQNIFKPYPPPFGLFERYVYRHTAAAIAGNHEAAQILDRRGYQGQIAVIPQMGIDPDLFSPAVRPLASMPTIGFAGRLIEPKGVLVLIEALASVPPPSRLHLIGSGPLEAQARALATRLGVQARITWEPVVASTEMPSRLQNFDVLVLPSLTTRDWKEQFGRVLAEAMACGVPVVGSDSGEIPHVIGGVGEVVPEGNPAALANTLTALLADPRRRQGMSVAGRERVLARYTQQRIAREIVDLYVKAGSQRTAGLQHTLA